ncbi:MAG: hypothetical protein VX589_00610 [Myxococcota bacterium]|nr:hypothetical protein [Myxococcota bacterium]
MSQNQGNRKRRGRGAGRGNRANRGGPDNRSYLSTFKDDQEDPQTFWARSNARLGIDAGTSDGTSQRRSKAPIDFPCAACGVPVLLEKWPKDRHEVLCDNCRGAVGHLLDDSEAEIAQAYRRQHGTKAKTKFDGLPEMTEEDLAAVSEMRSQADRLGNGRSGNRRRGSQGGQRKRRRSSGGGGQGQSRTRTGQTAGGKAGGGRRRRRKKTGRSPAADA